MSSYGSNLWTVNLTGLVDDTIWHTFNITAYDELADDVLYEHYRMLYRGSSIWENENIVFKTGVPTVHESNHLGFSSSNVSTDLYNSNYVLYLFDYFYDDTAGLYGDGEHLESVLPHEQGVDGSINDTGRWVNQLPGATMNQRYCFDFSGGFFNLVIVAIIFGLVNAFIRPVVKLLTLPINLVTLGLFTLVINTLMLMLTVWLSDSLSLIGGLFQNFIVAFVAAIIISIISTVLSWLLPD